MKLVDVGKDRDSPVLRATELTGILGRSEFDRLALVCGEDWENYRESYEKASQLHESEFPIQLDFELNASCNFKCPMCPISAESPKGKGKDTWFDFTFFKEIIKYAVKNGTKAIKLNYINEPLIRPDFFDFVEFAKAEGIVDVYFSTNGMLLTSKVRSRLLESGVTRVQVSIDAASEAVFDEIRPGGDFDTVVANTLSLISERNARNLALPLVRVNFVKTNLNSSELEPFLDFWGKKVEMVGVQEFVPPPTSSSEVIASDHAQPARKDFKCSFPFKQLVITNEKKVLPCCTFWGEHMPLGEITCPEDLKRFWSSAQMEELRFLHANGLYHQNDVCVKCLNDVK